MTNAPKYGSDLIVDFLKSIGIEYASLNPGSTFRGLHESIVNYGGNKAPEIIECCHEEVAVQIAHGYAKATGKPMVAIVHDVVGLLHSTMALYYAYLDKVPMIVLGATGPMDVTKRRARTDWIHTALIQGNLIRGYVKWDDQPYNIESVPESLVRGYRTTQTEPQGPVYICFDVSLQETPVSEPISRLAVEKFAPPTRFGADQAALEKMARMIVDAEFPVAVADTLGRHPEAVDDLVRLAECATLPVVDLGGRFNFPNTHPLDVSDTDALAHADLIVALDVANLYAALTKVDSVTRKSSYIAKEDTPIVQIGLIDLRISGLVLDYFKLHPVEFSIAGDTSIVLPELTKICLRLLDGADRKKLQRRKEKIREIRDVARKRWHDEARRIWDQKPVSTARLTAEVWELIKNEDWVMASGTLTGSGWVRKLWNLDKPYRYVGRGWGTATNIGISLGVALAHKQSGRVIVDLQPDGDLLYDASALWTAAHHKIPMLIVMHNNRGYWNDWEHQINISKLRGRPHETAHVGIELDHPSVDFAKLAQSMAVYGEGPIEDPDKVGPALQRALKVVKENRSPALVDVICQPR